MEIPDDSDTMVLFALAAALLFAQQTEQLSTIEGKVVDALTQLPVAGARVVAARMDKPGGIPLQVLDTKPSDGEQDPQADVVAVTTGDDGRFRMRFQGSVRFALFADAAGYVKPMRAVGPDNIHRAEAGTKQEDIVIRLTRETAAAGRVIDGKTGEPLRGLVAVLRRRRAGSPGGLFRDGSSTTDQDGRFRIERIAPGDYYLEIHPPLGAKIEAPTPVEDFRHTVRKDYASSWYPGVERFEDAVPVKVLPGTGVEGLEIKIEKRILAALRGRVAADDGTEGEVQVSLVRVATQVHAIQIAVTAQGTVKIGAEFEIDNVPPGTYSLRAEALGREKADGRWASMPLPVGEENQDGLDLVLRKAVRVTGRVRIEGREDNSGEPALSTDDMRVSLSPTVGFGSAPFPAPAQVAVKDGAFAFEGVIPDQYKLLAKAPAGYAVSEVRYNGEVCPYVVSIETGAEEQKLEIKLAAANGSVVAVVSDGTRPAAGATVVLMPEPVTDEGLRLGGTLLPAETGKDGRVTISGLLPGAYRLTAYPANGTWLDDPGLKRRLEAGEVARVTGAQPVTVQVRVQ